MKVNNFIKVLYSQRSIKRTESKILQLGSGNTININKLLGWKVVVLVFTFIVSLLVFNTGYLVAPVITVAVYLLYDYYFLDVKIKKRIKIIEHDAIFFFEVLSLTLQSDRNLKQCLVVTTDSIDSELSREFKYVLSEVKLGKSLTESLNDCKNRIPSKSVRDVLLNIIESNTYGNNIVDSLDNQIDYLMDRRILDIKGQINKIPTNISIISVLFFIPVVMLLILGSVLINYFLG